MKALIFRETGEPKSVLKLAEIPTPPLPPGAALVRVLLSPIHASDLHMVRGRYGYFAPVTNTKVLRVDIDNPGSYAVCDLVNTDASAASNFYANMTRVGDYIFLCSDKTGGGKFLRLQIS